MTTDWARAIVGLEAAAEYLLDAARGLVGAEDAIAQDVERLAREVHFRAQALRATLDSQTERTVH